MAVKAIGRGNDVCDYAGLRVNRLSVACDYGLSIADSTCGATRGGGVTDSGPSDVEGWTQYANAANRVESMSDQSDRSTCQHLPVDHSHAVWSLTCRRPASRH